MLCSSFSASQGVLKLDAQLPSIEAVAQYMGMPDANGSEDTLQAIEEAMQRLEPVMAPMAIWALVQVGTIERNSLTFLPEDKDELMVNCNGLFFRGSQNTFVSLLTLGKACDAVAGELYEEDILIGMAFDAAASATISLINKGYLSRQREALKEKGLMMGLAYAPGCQALPLTAQRSVFSLLHPERFEIYLSEFHRITPAKSVTSIAPVGTDLPKWMMSASPCQLCTLRKTCRVKDTRRCGS